MNTRNLLVSSLMLVCVVLSACAPAATPTQAPTTMPQPTDIPPTQTPIVAVGSVVDLSLVPDISNGIETISVDFLNNRGPLQAFDSIWFLSDTEGKVTRWNPETR